MDTETQFKLEIETRKARDMCSVLSKEELTDLIVTMYRSDFLKNEYIKTLILGDFYGSPLPVSTSDTVTEQEAYEMALWIIGSQ